MLVLVSYDVSTIIGDGKTRLRKVAKICKNYGVRVQNSVFECVVDGVQLAKLKDELNSVIDKNCDSLRFYNLGSSGRKKVEHIGAKVAIDVEGLLIL